MSEILTSLRVLTRKQLATDKGIDASNPSLLRWEQRGIFPRRFYLTEKKPVWFEKDVDAWLIARSEQRTSTTTATATEARRATRQS